MTDTTPAALERIMERLRQLARGAGSTTQSTCTEAAAVIAVLGAQVRDLTLQRDTARAVASLLTGGEKDNG